ncbi:hypothetical protein Sjap_020376 [Stephania japonica]|uniref:Uncharacterized protein n=1 Tax=Stephania japonica TaxID=461633 RepID=A0AAP0HYY2_9MAGN
MSPPPTVQCKSIHHMPSSPLSPPRMPIPSTPLIPSLVHKPVSSSLTSKRASRGTRSKTRPPPLWYSQILVDHFPHITSAKSLSLRWLAASDANFRNCAPGPVIFEYFVIRTSRVTPEGLGHSNPSFLGAVVQKLSDQPVPLTADRVKGGGSSSTLPHEHGP